MNPFVYLKLPEYFFCCRLKTLGAVLGWLGVVYRTMTLTTCSVLASRITDYDPNLFFVIITILITYSSLSLLANFLLLVGIHKRISMFLLPYLSMEIVEIIILFIGFIFGIIVFSLVGQHSTLAWFVPTGVIVLALLMYMWLCLVNYYIQMNDLGF